MIECSIVIARIERHRCRVHALLRSLWCWGRPTGRLAFADAQIESRAFEQLPFFRIPFQDGPKKTRRTSKVMLLKRLDTALVDGDGLVESRLARGRWWRRLRRRCRRWEGGGCPPGRNMRS